jgi:uncharacterized protein (TIGR00304 family)
MADLLSNILSIKQRRKRMQNQETREEASKINVAATWLLVSGFVLMFTGIIILIAASVLQGNMDISGGGIVFIGPIPIIFGVGPNAYLAILLAAILTIIGFLVFFWLRKKVTVARFLSRALLLCPISYREMQV